MNKMQDPTKCCLLQGMYFKYKDTEKLKVNGRKNMSCKRKHKKVGVTLLTLPFFVIVVIFITSLYIMTPDSIKVFFFLLNHVLKKLRAKIYLYIYHFQYYSCLEIQEFPFWGPQYLLQCEFGDDVVSQFSFFLKCLYFIFNF